MDVQSLWWQAGRLAYEMPEAGWLEHRWHDSVRRAAAVLEPVNTPEGYSSGPWSFALPTIALTVYTGRDQPPAKDVTVDWIIEQVADRDGLEGRVRSGLERYNNLADGDRIGKLFSWLTQYQEPTGKYGYDLPSVEDLPGGTLLSIGAGWAEDLLTRHYVSTAAS
ncbi:hypothetical protein ACWDRR_32945 [Kitasatospora sp. NPDC003701]